MESRRSARHAQDADRLVRRSARALDGRASEWDSLLTASDLGASHEGPRRHTTNQLDKDALVDQINHSFHLETQSFRSRILEATDEAARARERIDDVHKEMVRLRKKCVKLQKMVQERDATIACMQEQQDLQLPMLMHETMRSLRHAMEDNQEEEDVEARVLRSSVHRNRHERSILQEQRDDRVHEYEKQISRLYEELHQEKQKNESLQECLKEQKHARKKLLKACKFAKQEIEALRASDITHLLEDLEIKCKELEHKNAALQDDLDFETTQVKCHNNPIECLGCDAHIVNGKVATARQERDDLQEELAARRQESSDWAARLEAKQREIERLRAQIHEQQCALENFQRDYDLVAERTAPRVPGDVSTNAELQQECDLLIRALHREKARVADLERQVEEASTLGRSRDRDAARSPGSDDAASLLPQIAAVREKVRRLRHRLVEYTETQGLSSSGFSGRDDRAVAVSGADSLSATDALSQCGAELEAMQRLMEESFARALGTNCAMQ